MSMEEKFKSLYYDSKLPCTTKAERVAYRADRRRLYEQLKVDTFADCGVAEHPCAEQAWRIAQDLTCSAHECYNLFSELAEVFMQRSLTPAIIAWTESKG
jgi:hypothetical protein